MRCGLVLLVLGGCFGGDAPPTPRKRAPVAAEARSPGAAKALANILEAGHPPPQAVLDNSFAKLDAGVPALVMLVVMDTVRADHLTACGYKRPTSPALTTLIGMGGTFTCDAYAPATWTIPSHATFFTGDPVDTHDMHRKGLTLPDRFETLAEVYEARGYQTLALSANPVLKESTGMLQGFQRALTPKGLTSGLRGPGFSQILRAELAKLDKSKPLFLFLNLFDAHDPYPAVPDQIGWLPSRGAFHYRNNVKDPSTPYNQFFSNTLSAEAQAEWLAHATDGYDWGIAIADRNLGKALKLIQKQGWIDHGVRLVLTSDHGEYLGEHDLVRHDGPPFEAVTRVPFLYYDSLTKKHPELPSPMPAAHAFHLLANGTLDPEIKHPVASSIDYETADPRYVNAVAVWGADGQKAMWRAGTSELYALSTDPEEASPGPIDGHPLEAELSDRVTLHIASRARAFGKEADAGVLEMLDELGYVDPGE